MKLANAPWFMARGGLQATTERLRKAEIGSFCLRPSSSPKFKYTLDVRIEQTQNGNAVRSKRISQHTGGLWQFEGEADQGSRSVRMLLATLTSPKLKLPPNFSPRQLSAAKPVYDEVGPGGYDLPGGPSSHPEAFDGTYASLAPEHELYVATLLDLGGPAIVRELAVYEEVQASAFSTQYEAVNYDATGDLYRLAADLAGGVYGVTGDFPEGVDRATYEELGSRQAEIKLKEEAVKKSKAAFEAFPEMFEAQVKLATDKLTEHKSQYDVLFSKWRGSRWLSETAAAHSAIVAKFPVDDDGLHLQPNPWVTDGVKPTSKRYLIRLLEAYTALEGSGQDADPATTGVADGIASTCHEIAAAIGAEKLRFEMGPAKGKDRVFEKSLATGGRFDKIRDYARGMFVVDDLAAFPRVLHAIADRAGPGFEPIRAKNRLDPGWNAIAGYRDYQLLIRSAAGWIVELQVIPAETYKLKSELGHSSYAKYRFIVDAARRARAASVAR